MKLTHSPIQRKLMKIILLTSAAVLLLTCTSFFVYEYFAFRQTNKTNLSTLGEIIATNSTAALAFQSREDAFEILNALKAEKHVVAACLYDASGHLFAKYPLYSAAKDFPARPQEKGYTYVNSFLEGYQPVVERGTRLGTLYLRSDMKVMYERFQLYSLIVLLVVVVSSVLAFLLSKRLQKTISDPILSLADTAAIISNEHDYTVRAEKKADDELGLLTDAFNQMLTQIEAQNAEIRAFNQALEKKVVERTIELKQTNNELKLQNDFVEAILDASVHHIAVVDLNMRFTTINKMVEKTYGLKKNEVLGRSYTDVFPKTENSKTHNDIKAALRGEYIHNNVIESVLVNGYFENYVIPLKNDNVVYGALILSHDISQIVEANEKLVKVNAALEKSNNDLEQFAYVASHDLQEPLRKIKIFSHYIEQNINNREATITYLSKIILSAERMTQLIKAVLNYSRLSSTDELFEQVDLNEIIESVRSDLELMINEKEAVIKTDKLPVINGIKLQLSQLFLNLIGNSLKFTDKKPVISISAVTVSGREIEGQQNLDPNLRYLKIILQDNGIGFDQKYSDKIFNVFQRLHNKTSFPGTGIGLALCKKIAENHKGSISVSSEAGKGATFYIYLPF